MSIPVSTYRDRLAKDASASRRAHAGAFLLVPAAAAILLLAALFFCLLPGDASATPSNNGSVVLQGEAKSQVDALTKEAEAVQAQIHELDDELEVATEAYNRFSVTLDEINGQLLELRRKLRYAESDYDRRYRRYQARIVEVYKSGGRDQLLQILFLSNGFEDFVNRVRLISRLANQDKMIVENLDNSTFELNRILAEIDAAKQEELVIRRQMERERRQIESRLQERKRMLDGIDAQIAAVIEQERARQEAEQEELRQSILRMAGGAQYTGPIPLNGDPVVDQLIQTACTYMGIPYVWAGDRPSTGFDCSGFTQFVYAQHGVMLPHYSGYQAQMGMPVDPSSIQAGDLLAFGFPVCHVGIYIGDGLFIHAPRTGDVIRIQHLSERTNLSAIRRFALQQRLGPPAVW